MKSIEEKNTKYNKLSLNKKVFKPLSNSSNAEVDSDTLFYYFQDKDTVWADYSGGDILKGHLIGKQLDNGNIEFFYHHLNRDGNIKIGKCTSEIKIENNKIKLYEKWQWLCDDMSTGFSELIECN
jgi:hypothetical protein